MSERWDGDEEEITPDDPDWDLSESHGYLWEPGRHRFWPPPALVMVLITLLLVLALVLPSVIILTR
jgi:hypothetical protein